jgi:hypothetical protein
MISLLHTDDDDAPILQHFAMFSHMLEKVVCTKTQAQLWK